MQINWMPAKLQLAWRLALENIGNDRLCIFIDGLDEFTGDYEDLLDVLLEANQVRNIKLCLSSRPIASMTRRLSSYPSLSLQQLNEPDIKTYVQGKLQPYGDLQKSSHGVKVLSKSDQALMSHENLSGLARIDCNRKRWRHKKALVRDWCFPSPRKSKRAPFCNNIGPG